MYPRSVRYRFEQRARCCAAAEAMGGGESARRSGGDSRSGGDQFEMHVLQLRFHVPKRQSGHSFGRGVAVGATYAECGYSVYRFHSRAPRGLPAVGLLLMRVAVALTIAGQRPTRHFAELVAALLLVGGAWTPAAAALIAAFEIWRLIFQAGGWVSLLLATMAMALFLIGPGTWSFDARIFGWRRVDIPPPHKVNEGAKAV